MELGAEGGRKGHFLSEMKLLSHSVHSLRERTAAAVAAEDADRPAGMVEPADPLNLMSLSLSPSVPLSSLSPRSLFFRLPRETLESGNKSGRVISSLLSLSPLFTSHHVMPMAVNEREGGAKTAAKPSPSQKLVGDFSSFCVDAAAAAAFEPFFSPSHRI